MRTDQITISVGADAASAYRAASEEDRRKLDLILSLRLTEAARSSRPLRDVMRQIRRNAEERGLTPGILESLLDEQ